MSFFFHRLHHPMIFSSAHVNFVFLVSFVALLGVVVLFFSAIWLVVLAHHLLFSQCIHGTKGSGYVHFGRPVPTWTATPYCIFTTLPYCQSLSFCVSNKKITLSAQPWIQIQFDYVISLHRRRYMFLITVGTTRYHTPLQGIILDKKYKNLKDEHRN